MFNWVVKRNDSSLLDPIRTTMGSHFDKMFEDFDKIFEDPFFKDSSKVLNYRGTTDFPKVDIIDEGDTIAFNAAVAGIPKDDIKVEYDKDNQILTLRCESSSKNESNGKTYISREISKRSFLRRFPLNSLVYGDPEAELKDGILSIKFKKSKPKEVENKIKNIEIK